MSSEQQLGQLGIVIRTLSLSSCNPVWPGLPGALWSSPGSRKKGRGVYWGGSSESVLLPKGGSESGHLQQQCPGFSPRLAGES